MYENTTYVCVVSKMWRCEGSSWHNAVPRHRAFSSGDLRATGLSLTTPFTEGRLGWELITKPRPLAVIRNRRLNSVALLAPLRSVQFSSVIVIAHFKIAIYFYIGNTYTRKLFAFKANKNCTLLLCLLRGMCLLIDCIEK